MANFWKSSHNASILKYEDYANLINENQIKVFAKNGVNVNLQEIEILHCLYAKLIQRICVQLKVKQIIVATATYYFKMFYMNHCFYDFDPRIVAATCIFLAGKVEEFHLRPSTIVGNLIKCLQQSVENGSNGNGNVNNVRYTEKQLLALEYYVLEGLNYRLLVFHPYRPLLQYAQDADLQDCLQKAWFIINDSYRTNAVLMYPPHILALSSLHIAAVISHKDTVKWLSEINVDVEEIEQVTKLITNLYEYWKQYDISGGYNNNNALTSPLLPNDKIKEIWAKVPIRLNE